MRTGVWLGAAALSMTLGVAEAQAPAATAAAVPPTACAADPNARVAWPADWSPRRRLVHLAVCEWARFGYPVVEIQRTGEATAIRLPTSLGLSAALTELPQRPSYEGARPILDVQTRTGLAEDDASVAPAIEAYWAATDPAYIGRIRQARATVRQAHPGEGGAEPTELYPGWWRAWSAAFITWAVTKAEVPWFRGSEWHTVYLARSSEGAPERLVRIEDYRPVVGDLICAGRTGASGPQGLPTSQSFIDRVRAIRTNDDAFAGHCDIIVRVNRSSVLAIGGNVRNAVSATVTPLVRGRLMRSNARPWSAALRMNGPRDPCARIEAVPVGPWTGEGAASARRRALRGAAC